MEDFLEVLLSDDSGANLQLADPTLVNYYYDLKHRCIWIDTEIDNDTLALVQHIIRWNREDKDIEPAHRKPITIYFNSVGGSLDVAEIICSIITLSQTPVYGIALGLVASAASLMFLSCHKRFALPNAYFLVHRGSCSSVSGNYNEVQAMMADYRAQVEKMEQFYIAHTLYSEEEVKARINTDWYIRGDEILEKGLITDWLTDLSIIL